MIKNSLFVLFSLYFIFPGLKFDMKNYFSDFLAPLFIIRVDRDRDLWSND